MRSRLPTRRGAARAGSAALALALASLVPAAAEEPLFLRIRPQGAALPEIGAGGAQGPSEAEVARAARAAREAVWERANARARIVIASVCTGCMKPLPPAPSDPIGARAASAPATASAPAEAPSPRPE